MTMDYFEFAAQNARREFAPLTKRLRTHAMRLQARAAKEPELKEFRDDIETAEAIFEALMLLEGKR